MSKSKYAAIVLAAGLSSRMNQFKPLLPLGNTTILENVVTTYSNAGVDVIVVVGHRKEEVKKALKNKGINIVYNSNYKKGMLTSIQAGVKKLHSEYQAFFIHPVDIPLVRPSTVKKILDADLGNPDNIIYPTFTGKRGHPPLIPAKLVPDILGWGKDGGLKAVLDANEKMALEVPVADSFILFDIDTVEDYLGLLERYHRYTLPTKEECNEIFTNICHVAPDRIKHCQKVAEAAAEIARAFNMHGAPLDIEVVYTAALLHDIAKNEKKHDIAGGKILREMGFGGVADIVAVHSDLAGGNTGLSLEAKIVYITDKLYEGEKLVSLEKRYQSTKQWHTSDPEAQAAIDKRLKVAQGVKINLEKQLGHRLEIVISSYI